MVKMQPTNKTRIPGKILLLLLCCFFESAAARQSRATQEIRIDPANPSAIYQLRPCLPAFLRSGDHPVLQVTIRNLSDSELTGQISLELLDPVSQSSLDSRFENIEGNQFFTVESHQDVVAEFSIAVPFEFETALNCRMAASAHYFKENKGALIQKVVESSIPVIVNFPPFSKSFSFHSSGSSPAIFSWPSLLESGKLENISHKELVLEYTTNPIWFALMALPALKPSQTVTAEQNFFLFWAQCLSIWFLDSFPNLSRLVQWPREEKGENIFAGNRPENYATGREALLEGMRQSLQNLRGLQLPSGGFPWFPGGEADRYITQYLLCGFGKLEASGFLPVATKSILDSISAAALGWLDLRITEDYAAIQGSGSRSRLSGPNRPGNLQVQYLYMRSFFPEIRCSLSASRAADYFLKNCLADRNARDPGEQAMIALTLFRSGKRPLARNILSSLISGLNLRGSQVAEDDLTGMIEALWEIPADQGASSDLLTRLLGARKNDGWNSSRTTASACYLILRMGQDKMLALGHMTVSLGRTRVFNASADSGGGSARAGYLRKKIRGAFVKPEMGKIELETAAGIPEASAPGWGSLRWEYTEEAESAELPRPPGSSVQLTRRIFLVKNGEHSNSLEPLADHGQVRTGDSVRVRIILHASGELKYLRLKDLPAACMQNPDTRGLKHVQKGFNYFEIADERGTWFYLDRLPRGNWIFEYGVRVNQPGEYHSGTATLESADSQETLARTSGSTLSVAK
jgi:hypothetical protein